MKQDFCIIYSYSKCTLGKTCTTVDTQCNIKLYIESVTKTGRAVPLLSFHSDVFHLEEQEGPFLYHLQSNSGKKKVTMRIKKKPKQTSKVKNCRSKYCYTKEKKVGFSRSMDVPQVSKIIIP